VFRSPEWREMRLDIDEDARPNLVSSITHLPLADASVDAVWTSHTVEHLYPHEVSLAFAEFSRVLAPGGFLLLTLPDLQRVAEMVAADQLTDVAYVSPVGPITPLDMIFGHRVSIASGRKYMAHHTGFTAKLLAQTLLSARFSRIKVERNRFSLWACAQKPALVGSTRSGWRKTKLESGNTQER
jgi:predicted SAM-dependent methyltransferase